MKKNMEKKKSQRQTEIQGEEPKKETMEKKKECQSQVETQGEESMRETTGMKKFTLSDFFVHKNIGKGSIGSVFLATNKSTKFVCALKLVFKSTVQELGLFEQSGNLGSTSVCAIRMFADFLDFLMTTTEYMLFSSSAAEVHCLKISKKMENYRSRKVDEFSHSSFLQYITVIITGCSIAM